MCKLVSHRSKQEPTLKNYFEIFSIPSLIVADKGEVYNLPIAKSTVSNVIQRANKKEDPEEEGFIERIANTGQELMDRYEDWLDDLGLWFFPRPIKILLTVIAIFGVLSLIIYLLTGESKQSHKLKTRKRE
eukprot:TRINITY_DN12962_c0_g1_i2.p2 TRINITY_DN12962_c0_g1~~TRINITY_DN12962_c0_g1_i2.p2  ORF type:complete len:131 (-),score=30.84 TRINITY_DN12962_c0_g1_i2:98-490(-)